jgi:hypothetical protein
MAKKYTKKRRGGNISNLQSDFNELEMIVEKINNDVKELKKQITNVDSTNVDSTNVEGDDSVVEKSENNNDKPEIVEENDKNDETNEIEEKQSSDEKTLEEKKTDIKEMIKNANNMLYVEGNCNLKMNKKPCNNGKDTLDGFERAVNKSDFNDDKADALKSNVANYINRITNELNIRGGRKTKKVRKNRKRLTKRR